MRIALPDERGRAAILRVHSRKLRLADDVSLDDVAEKTPSFSGAELAALCNEAAIRAARRGDQHVTQADFASAMSSYVDSRRPGLGVDALLGKMLRGFGRSFVSGRRQRGWFGTSYPPTAIGNVNGNAMPKYQALCWLIMCVPV